MNTAEIVLPETLELDLAERELAELESDLHADASRLLRAPSWSAELERVEALRWQAVTARLAAIDEVKRVLFTYATDLEELAERAGRETAILMQGATPGKTQKAR